MTFSNEKFFVNYEAGGEFLITKISIPLIENINKRYSKIQVSTRINLLAIHF